MHESAFLQSMRDFRIAIDQNTIVLFGNGSMKARFTNAHLCPTRLVFGGNIGFMFALWICTKKGIDQSSKGWEFNCKFKSPAPISEEFTVRLERGEYRASRYGHEFASATLNVANQETIPTVIKKPEFSVVFSGDIGQYQDEELVCNLPETDNWHERLYYLTSTCDWGIWVLGQLLYPDATFVSGTLSIIAEEYLSSGQLTLKPISIVPISEDRIQLIVSVYSATRKLIGTASAVLVNYDYEKKCKLPLPERVNN